MRAHARQRHHRVVFALAISRRAACQHFGAMRLLLLLQAVDEGIEARLHFRCHIR